MTMAAVGKDGKDDKVPGPDVRFTRLLEGMVDPQGIQDEPPPYGEPLSARWRKSYAYITVKKRMALILDTTMRQFDLDLNQLAQESAMAAFREERGVRERLTKLINEVILNAPFTKLESTGPDVEEWNRFLRYQAQREKRAALRWYYTKWLYAECYMYRRLREVFELTRSLRRYDPFRKMKLRSLKTSIKAMDCMARELLRQIDVQPRPGPVSYAVASSLKLFLAVSLWGNRDDLSHSGGMTINAGQAKHPLSVAESLSPYILINDMDKLWETLVDKVANDNRIVDIVPDNAGYELFADMCLADFILTFRLADKVRFHLKAIPWFVSDATLPDLQKTIKFMAVSNNASRPLAVLAERWHDYLACGHWEAHNDQFWTLPYDYDAMRCEDPALYMKLHHASIVLFKGDLNFRKLVGDINWEPNTSFRRALRHFRPSRILSLRTLKSDVVVGMSKNMVEKMTRVCPDWMLGAKYATVQYAKPPPGIPGVVDLP